MKGLAFVTNKFNSIKFNVEIKHPISCNPKRLFSSKKLSENKVLINKALNK